MALSRFQVSFLSACFALPILLLMKVIGGVDHPAAIFAVGVVSLLVVFLVPRLYFREGPPKHDPFYNVWSIFLFASLVDIVVALENDGYVENYLHFYLLRGEPYLKTPYGTMINYWDGTVHLALILFVLSRTAYDIFSYQYYTNWQLHVSSSQLAFIIIIGILWYNAWKLTLLTSCILISSWSIFMFSSLVDIIVALENDGYIGRYLHFYLLNGEPYLKTPHGTQICYWDGTVHLVLNLFILSRTAYNEEYRLACLYWCGSILNSVAVLVPGGIISRFGPQWSILLNVPYVVIPLYVLFKVLSSRSASTRNVLTSIGRTRQCGPVEWLFIFLFVCSFVINGFRAIVALDCKAGITKTYMKTLEPFLADDLAFPKMQMLVYLFYFMPYYVYAIYRMIYAAPSGGMMTDLAFVHAGAAAQAQFVYLTTAVHSRTPANLRIPSSSTAQLCFWIINVALLVIPHLFAYRCFDGQSRKPERSIKSPEIREDSPSRTYNLRKRRT